jgi:hypothetical protein
MSYFQDFLLEILQAQLVKNPTGFSDPANVQVDYDSTTRKITLSGTIKAYYNGILYGPIFNGYVSPAHVDADGVYYLSYDGTSVSWKDPANLNFYELLIAYAIYKTNFKFGLRECHEFMPWPTHLELHETIGTYKKTGGGIGAYVLSSTTPAERRPSVDALTLYDEDLPTEILQLAAEGSYSQFTLSSSDTTNISTTPIDIVPLSGNQPYFNEFSGGTWGQTLMSNNYRMSVWLVAVPVSADTESQKYRFLWVQGQEQNLTLATEQALSSFDVDLGEFSDIAPEFLFIGRVIIRYQAANWYFEYVEAIDGTKSNQTQSPAATAHNSTTGKQGGTTDEYYHLTATDYNALTDVNAQLPDLHTDGSPEFADVDIPNATGGDLLKVGSQTGSSSPRITFITRNSGYAPPANNDAVSDGDKWIFWNSTAYKGAIGFDARTMYFQSTEGTTTDNNRFKFFAGSSGVPIEILALGDGNVGFHWNDTGIDLDFTVEALGVADALLIDGADGSVTLGKLTAGVVSADASGKLSTSPDLGRIEGFLIKYEDATHVDIEPGIIKANGSLYTLSSTYNHLMTSLAAGYDQHYIYIDDDASTPPTPTIIDSTTEPAWSHAKNGWYNGDDRCIGAVPSKSAASQLEYFFGYKISDRLVKVMIGGAAFQLASVMNPNGAWQTPNTQESSYYTPVNAKAVGIRMYNTDAGNPVKMSWTTSENAVITTTPTDVGTRETSYDELMFTTKGALDVSRNVKISGLDTNDNNLGAWVVEYDIEI